MQRNAIPVGELQQKHILHSPYNYRLGQMSVFWHLTLIFLRKYYIIKCGMFICTIWRIFCEEYSFSFNFKRRFL